MVHAFIRGKRQNFRAAVIKEQHADLLEVINAARVVQSLTIPVKTEDTAEAVKTVIVGTLCSNNG